jgi:hypothetical protein
MRGIIGVFIGALLAGVALGGALWYEHARAAHRGGVYVGVTDATSDMSGISDVDVSIKKAELHRKGGAWVTLSSDEKTYHLLSLKADGALALFGHARLQEGAYDRVRITFGGAVVRTTEGSEIVADMPGRVLVADMPVTVDAKSDTNIKVDILADLSLHAAQGGRFVFAPTAMFEVRPRAMVNVASDDTIRLSGGEAARMQVGMDLSGASRIGYALETDETLRIEDNEQVGTVFIAGDRAYQGDSASLETSVPSAANVSAAETAAGGAGGAGVDLLGGLNVP